MVLDSLPRMVVPTGADFSKHVVANFYNFIAKYICIVWKRCQMTQTVSVAIGAPTLVHDQSEWLLNLAILRLRGVFKGVALYTPHGIISDTKVIWLNLAT